MGWSGRGPEALGKLVGLTAKRCVPCEGGKVEKLSEADANRLRNQVRPAHQPDSTKEGPLCGLRKAAAAARSGGRQATQPSGCSAEASCRRASFQIDA